MNNCVISLVAVIAVTVARANNKHSFKCNLKAPSSAATEKAAWTVSAGECPLVTAAWPVARCGSCDGARHTGLVIHTFNNDLNPESLRPA